MKNVIVFLIVIVCAASCMPSNQFQKKYYLPTHQWLYADAKTFEFTIADTIAKYNLQFLMQHSEAYANSNIWLKMITKYPTGTIDSQRIEVPLALPDGHWLGRKANKMVEHTLNITPNALPISFVNKGKYTITLLQDMRKDSMAEVEYIGLQIDKVITSK
jgi:gliding motility-associated lipoprotein GldH